MSAPQDGLVVGIHADLEAEEYNSEKVGEELLLFYHKRRTHDDWLPLTIPALLLAIAEYQGIWPFCCDLLQEFTAPP